ncbi:bifunctional UDP-sugar hydrolase/5'-nucleotidase [Gracilibacillus sp. YIM 98692]|uniref:bifunctional metallophosphatase/5'-nucleotidase n=1 Tax=Gracilibacillus sp. YIM 98692 TaxID=2663532 RepID=UPI0013D23B7C|nr:bifunctional UDP-sugar hydrolase/5'-nucleotidase [Gracilibacillus sp. YIM 98692]
MKSISICVTSDVHGYLFPTNYRDQKEASLGLAKVASIFNELKKDKQVLLINNGDYIQGSPFTYYFAKYQQNEGNPMIQAANEMDYDLAVLGNHEFNYGLNYLQQVIAQSKFPWLAANILDKYSGEPFFGKPYVIREINGMKIACIGITTHYIPYWEDSSNIKNLVFEDACKSATKWVAKVRDIETPDFVILSYHGGLECDPETGEKTEKHTGENQGYQICEEVDGIDLLITGHQHRFITSEINGIPVIQPGDNGQALGEIIINFKTENNNVLIKSVTPTLHYVDDRTEPDDNLIKFMMTNEKEVQEWLDQPMAVVVGDMKIDDPFIARLKGHPFITYINQLQMQVADVDISCTALFHNQSPGFPEKVTMRDIVSNYIYPNTLKVLKLKGKDIKEALEYTASYFILDSEKNIIVNPSFIDPKPQHYNYDMWAGIHYEINLAKPVGDRITKLYYRDHPLELETSYHVVMNNYRASGGGDYTMFQGKEVVKDIPTDMTELIANDLLERKKIEATYDPSFRIVKS